MVAVTVDTPGPDDGVLLATDSHPFWDTNDREWVDAADLTTEDQLLAPDGQLRPVAATRTSERVQTVYNLTVADIHTYYVLAGDEAVLVHNCGRQTLFRSDTRHPDEIFEEGFVARGDNMDVLERASGWSTDSGYVATTTSERIAARRGGNVYEVRADGVDVNAAFPGNPFSHELEIAVPGRIAPECIVSCTFPGGRRLLNPAFSGD